MAKMKVHEIAKELEKQSKEVIAFLQNKGIEVKAPQSVIEEDTAEMVRKAFGQKGDAKQPAAKPAEKSVTAAEKDAPAAEKAAPENKEDTQKAPKPEAKGKESRPASNTGEQPKKKKKIIFVSNPHNSNIPGQRPQGERRPAQANKPSGQQNRSGSGNKSGGGNRQGSPRQEVPHKIIRPLTAPSVPESMQVDFKQNARRLENERIAARNAQLAAQEKAAQEKAAQEKAEKEAREKAAREKAAERTEKAPGQVRENNTGTPRQVPRDERRQRNERTQAGTGNNQGERNGRRDARRPEGANRTANQGGRSDFRGNGPG